MDGDFNSPWRVVWGEDRSLGRAIHASGLQVNVTRSGWATVMERPASISEVEATLLMAELQALLTAEEPH